MSFYQEGLYLVRFLASHGYTVVAVDYPLTGFHAPDGPLMRDIVNQPGDVSFLIDTLLQRNADPDDALYTTIDPKKIAVAGTSLGGLTVIKVTFHRNMLDPRIAAAISIAGPTSLFTADFFTSSDVPFLMIYGTGDVIIPYNTNATPVLRKHPDTIIVSLQDASHAGFAQPASTLMRFIANPDVVGCRAVKEGLKDELAGQNDQFMPLLGSAKDGIDMNAKIEFCSSPPIPVAMQAARQHMFTTLATTHSWRAYSPTATACATLLATTCRRHCRRKIAVKSQSGGNTNQKYRAHYNEEHTNPGQARNAGAIPGVTTDLRRLAALKSSGRGRCRHPRRAPLTGP